ncbi:LOW QUALITY PROTEIN: uncharacterized protein LOC104663786 [Rhinopithecus roxellana]|uniref:LOW QUALITY PROTEIN: uncharacterized protein LOC104663786 n=1 Tax=Rhinopithecus roxellana TaxID=61622 RepID=UPI00123783E1|nr:LOW QUALITY PROTEIN: uncharacterized protein LOC104663786 [Rhinopithecus roxellana]
MTTNKEKLGSRAPCVHRLHSEKKCPGLNWTLIRPAGRASGRQKGTAASKFLLAERVELTPPSETARAETGPARYPSPAHSSRPTLLSGKSSISLRSFSNLILTWHRTSPFLGTQECFLLDVNKIQLLKVSPGIQGVEFIPHHSETKSEEFAGSSTARNKSTRHYLYLIQKTIVYLHKCTAADTASTNHIGFSVHSHEGSSPHSRLVCSRRPSDECHILFL